MKNFKEKEFKMGEEIVFEKMDEVFLMKLDVLREICGFGIRLNSTYRSRKHNKKVGGASKSQHLYGKAGDLRWKGWSGSKKYTLLSNAIKLGFSVGISNSFLHIDDRNGKTMWIY